MTSYLKASPSCACLPAVAWPMLMFFLMSSSHLLFGLLFLLRLVIAPSTIVLSWFDVFLDDDRRSIFFSLLHLCASLFRRQVLKLSKWILLSNNSCECRALVIKCILVPYPNSASTKGPNLLVGTIACLILRYNNWSIDMLKLSVCFMPFPVFHGKCLHQIFLS